MYQMRYSDIIEESGVNARERESVLFDRCIKMLEKTREAGAGSPIAIETGRFIDSFWLTLIEDLGHKDNPLPVELKSSLVSIGIFVLKESLKMRNGEMPNIDCLIDISKSIRDGLASN